MLDNWDQNLAQQVKRKFENYFVKRIDLAVARADEEYNICGDFLCVITASSAAVAATVKLNRSTNPAISIGLFKPIETVFEKFYISNAVQAGAWIEVLTGINFVIQDDTRELVGIVNPTITMTNAAANVNTVGAANVCKEVLLKADVQNSDIVWVNFNAAAVQNACIPLDPGDWIVRRMPNTNWVNANFAVTNERLFVSFSN